MLSQPEPACLLLADITGYTSYLAGVELDHAQDILADLTDTVVGALRPSFRLAKLEGDAAFTYAPAATIDSSALMDTVERTYFAFRRRLRDIGQASQCECDACTRMPDLDLKFLAHHGMIGRQRVAGREELVGSPVIVAHRLLKNGVTDATGIHAYALYTDDCLRAAEVDPPTLGLTEHRETYDHLGEIVGWVSDLGAAWTADQNRTRVVVEPRAAIITMEFDLPGPPSLVWDYLTSPAHRPRWQAGVTGVFEETSAGRRGIGTTNHCMHGKDAVIEEVLDWRPPDYYTMRWQMPGTPKVLSTDSLQATPDGTHVTIRIARPRSARDRAFLEEMAPMLREIYREGAVGLTPLLDAELARQAEETAAAPEPSIPVSVGRFLTAPVDSVPVRTS